MSEPFKTPSWAEGDWPKVDWPAIIKAMNEAGESLRASVRETLARLDAQMVAARARRDASDPDHRERLSQTRYRRAIVRERERGLAHVKAEAYRVRKELGLPTAPVLYNVDNTAERQVR